MTSQEKANEIGTTIWKEWNDTTLAIGAEKGAILMAEWKDRQFKEYLERKKATHREGQIGYYIFSEIINELFGEK